MAYQVIARKWRPQKFEEVTGQEAITRTLRNAIEHDRLHHAYLFAGARGVGKTTTARLLAKALNCHKSDRPTPGPCAADDPEACASCREIAEGRSIDVLEIDAASNTGVDNVREAIINTVAVRPARDRFKVFIIDEVHMLSGAAFNALLKTLEEPPPRVVFVMATTESHKIPDTILSRSQQFEFRTIAAPKIAERLRLIADAEGIKVAEDALREIARAGEGSMRDAQSAFDQVISFSTGAIEVEDVETALGLAGAEVRARVVRAVAESRPADVLAVVDDLVMRGHDLRNFCRDLMAHVRDLLLVKVGGAAGDASDGERQRLAQEAGAFSESDLVRFFHSLTETERLLRESAHPRYQLEIGLVKLVEMRRLAPLSQILERLHALEEALRTGKAPAGGGPPDAPVAPASGGNAPPSRRGSAGLASSPADTPRRTAAPVTDEPPSPFAGDAKASSFVVGATASSFVGDAEIPGAGDASGVGPPTFNDEAAPFGDDARATDVATFTSGAEVFPPDAETPPFEPPPPRAPAATPSSAATSRVKSIPTLPSRSGAQANAGGSAVPPLPSKGRVPAPPAAQTSPTTPTPHAPAAATNAPQATPPGLRLVPTSSPASSSSSSSSPASSFSSSSSSSSSSPPSSSFAPAHGTAAPASQPAAPSSFFDAPPAADTLFDAPDAPQTPSAGGATFTPTDDAPPSSFVAPEASLGDGPSLAGAGGSGLLARVKALLDERRKPFLVIALEGARKVRFDDDELYVEFAPEGRHLRDTLAKPDNVKTLREVCAEAAGRGVGVRIAVKDAGEGDEEESARPSKRDEGRAEREQLRELAEQHPDVQTMLRKFRAEIIDVRRVEEVPPPSPSAAQPKRP